MEMKIEKWAGHDIRFVEVNGEWRAVLKDICDALDLKTFKISQRLDPRMLERVPIDMSVIPNKYNRSPGENRTRSMLVVSEEGIYEALYSSRKLEARKIAKCQNCGCEFSYEREDVLRDPVCRIEYYVNCPQCNNSIKVITERTGGSI